MAPYAILKHTTVYNATTSDTGVPELPVYQRKPSATTKQKNMKLKKRKQSTSQNSCPHGKPKTISPPTTAQPNYLTSCNTTLFHQKSKRINQGTLFPAAASTVHPHTKTSTASKKQMGNSSKKVTPNKRKKNIQWPTTTVQTKLIKRYKPLTCKLSSGPLRGDDQRGKDGQQDNASLENTVSSNFVTLPLDSKIPKTKKIFENISKTKKVANFSSTSNAVLSRSLPQSTGTSEMKHKSTEVSKLPKIWNNTNSAYETFKPTGKAFIYVQIHFYVVKSNE